MFKQHAEQEEKYNNENNTSHFDGITIREIPINEKHILYKKHAEECPSSVNPYCDYCTCGYKSKKRRVKGSDFRHDACTGEERNLVKNKASSLFKTKPFIEGVYNGTVDSTITNPYFNRKNYEF
jgi:hypothetical protein